MFLFKAIEELWLKSIQAFDQTEKWLLFDRISVAVIADDNTDGRDKQTITLMAGMNNILSKRYLK